MNYIYSDSSFTSRMLHMAQSSKSTLRSRCPDLRSGRKRRRFQCPGKRTSRSIVVLLFVLALAGLVLFKPFSLFGQNITVTIIPRSQMVSRKDSITAVIGKPDTAKQQIQAREITATTDPKTATGDVAGAATVARGSLIFLNNTDHAITVQTAIYTGRSGVPVTFTGPIVVPFNNPTTLEVAARAVNPGQAGNIPQLDIVQTLIQNAQGMPELVVKNTAFSGGLDAQQNPVVQQSDIDATAKPLVASQTAIARQNVAGLVRANERVVDHSIICTPDVTADHPPGTVAKTISVQVSVTCSEEVYDFQAARSTALAFLAAQATTTLGAGYHLAGQVSFVVQSTSVDAQTVTINTQIQALYRYIFSFSSLRQFADQIAGKSASEARSYLLQRQGIADVRFSSTNTLPTDSSRILVVQG
jgi:hypothetical protein